MRLSAPLHTSLHPINRHTAGAAGKLIFLLFFPLSRLLLLHPSSSWRGAGLCPHAMWDAGSGFPEPSPWWWRQWLSLPCCPNSPEPFSPRHLRAGPSSLRRASVPAARMKAAKERFQPPDQGLLRVPWPPGCDLWWPVGAFVWSKCGPYFYSNTEGNL